jgi:DNA polymerase-1
MLAAFKSGQDLHSLTASKIYNVEVSKKVNAHLRPIGKKINFSVAYGAGVHKISQELKISSKEASKILDNFYLGYPGLAAYFQKCFNNSLRNGYIEVDSLGRKSYISEYDELGKLIKLVELLNRPEDRKKLKTLAEQIQRNSQNYGIQGFAATMSKLAGVILRNKIKGSSAKILLLIHDEYVVECSKLEQEQIRLLVEESMRIAAKTLCKLVDIPADACITSVWNKD